MESIAAMGSKSTDDLGGSGSAKRGRSLKVGSRDRHKEFEAFLGVFA
jgi:hypothetical protein